MHAGMQACRTPDAPTEKKEVKSNDEAPKKKTAIINTQLTEGTNRDVLSNAIPLHGALPVTADDYIFSMSDDRARGEYSDSEEEDDDVPHFNLVCNHTKFWTQRWGDYDFVNNYVTAGEIITPTKLARDAKAITILCVALRQKDGRIKKFVFTNEEPGCNIRHTPRAFLRVEEHKLGYHCIQAQTAHAEGEMIQFLQERPTRYTHIVAMGCNRDHCEICDMMIKNVLHPDYRRVSGSRVSEVFDRWYAPTPLRHALKKKERFFYRYAESSV
jgi:hypothetical protein